jgi:murein DD-endopeptidase MepM/ murein hydrolase activator NlpD
MAAKRNGGRSASKEKKEKKVYSWWWLILIFGGVWFLTGFPLSFIRPRWVEVRAVVSEAPYGVSASSWHQDIALTIADRLLDWGSQHGIPETTLRGAFRAASLERDMATGKPAEGTGNRVDVFTILAITSIESSLSSGEVNPETSNPTGHCRVWSELMAHKLLNGVGEVAALRKIVQPLGYSEWRVYGSCGGGAIGWTQALPSNWWNLMGPGFDPWSREDAAEFTARYLTVHGYFTQGQRYAVHAYNPNAADSVYTLPVVRKAEQLGQSFADADLTVPRVQLAEKLDLEPETRSVTQISEVRLIQMPVEARRSGAPFGSPTIFQPDGHTGVDFGVGTGTPVHSVGDGIVVWADWWPEGKIPGYWKWANKGHGNTIWVLHGFTAEGEPVYSVYAHLSKYQAEIGDRVRASDVVGLSGNTGASSGPHLHFAIRVGGGWRRDGTDDQGRKWSGGQWVDPDEWVGKNAPTFFTEIPSGRETQQGVQIPTGQEVTLTLRETPVLKAALWTGKTLETLRTANEIGGYVPEGLIKKFDQLLGLLEKFESVLDRLHAVLSVWSIAGQPLELKLDPLLNWRILSSVE